jgi:hypothetical protein
MVSEADDFLIAGPWSPVTDGSPEERSTSCSLTIKVAGTVATRNASDWSQSVSDSVYVSAYPLALWLANSWWRLRWESGFVNARPTAEWRMAHDMPSAGSGFIWPPLRIVSDGQSLEMSTQAQPRVRLSREPIQYLANFSDQVAAHSFERAVDGFISTVLERLAALGISGTELQLIWSEVQAERADRGAATIRKLEAMSGFDPGQAPEAFLSQLGALAGKIGDGAATELAAGISGSSAPSDFSRVAQVSKSTGVAASMQVSTAQVTADRARKPWDVGHETARRLRKKLGYNGGCINSKKLVDLLGVRARSFPFAKEPSPIGLAVRTGGSSEMKLHFTKERADAQRFEAARFIAAHIFSPNSDRWLPLTDSRTVRQVTQRAFAAEFLAPIESLKEMMDGNFSDERIADMADEFQVSSRLICSHLANHRLITPDEVV